MDGRIGITMRVGVTGHRDLTDVDAVMNEVGQSIDRLQAAMSSFIGDRNITLEWRVISALALGADQLVAEELLFRGASLDVVLPLEPDDYLLDFAAEETKKKLNGLREQARRETVMRQAPHRNRAYLRCGQEVVCRSDVVIAIWDGEKTCKEGGTCDIVEFAQQRRVPLIWVPADGRHPGRPMIGTETADWSELFPLSERAATHLDRYNESLPTATLQSTGHELRDRIAGPDDERLDVAKVTDWIEPYFARAEIQANRAESRFKSIEITVMLLSLLAVSTVAGQSLLLPGRRWQRLVWIEVLCLIAGGVVVWWTRRSRLHDRWISARVLGETFRSALFLALAGIGDQAEDRDQEEAHTEDEDDPEDDDPDDVDDETEEEWMRRAFTEVWDSRPPRPTEPDLAPLQQLLASKWLGEQVSYHKREAARHKARKNTLRDISTVFFFASIAAAVLHSRSLLETGEHHWLPFASIVIPATAAALTGLAAQREYHLHYQRYRRMAKRLKELKVQMQQAKDLPSVQSIALETDRLVREENAQWFGVVRIHDLQLGSS
jgi:hypothetical protein